MASNGAKKKKKSKYLWRKIAAVLVFLAVVAGILMSITLFFNVHSIQVKGKLEIYSRESIVKASGLQVNMNMFKFSINGVQRKIMNTLPYVASVSVKRSLPDKVIIEVKEADNALILPYDGGVLVLSQDLGIIKSVAEYKGKAMTIKGIEPVSLKDGDVLEDDEPIRIENLKQLIALLADKSLLSSTTIVDTGDKLDLKLEMEGRITVELGTSGNMERKMLMLAKMMSEHIGEEEYGILNLKVAGKATFTPMSMEEYTGAVPGIEEPDEVPGEETPVENGENE